MPTGVKHIPFMSEVGLVSSVANCIVQASAKEQLLFGSHTDAMQKSGINVARVSYLLRKLRNSDFCVNFCKLNYFF